jgi:formylglycine-generating enzyme required for sulfatase activity
MKKLKFLMLDVSALSVMFVASMLLVCCGKGDGEDNGNGDDNCSGNITANGVSFDMVKVEGGIFTMGGTSEQDISYSDERPTHQVTLSDFSISSTEVTQALWKAVMGGWPHAECNPDCTFEQDGKTFSYGKGDNYPMYFVSWYDILGTDASAIGYTINGVTYYKNGFCYKLSELVGGGKKFRLPTEAEWEYAARGGNKLTNQTKYSGSNNIDDVAWYRENSNGENGNTYGTHEVAKKKANALGLYDMSGNLLEWCSDLYGEYSSDAQTNPTGASTYYPVLRGGYWNNDAKDCRVSTRRYGIAPMDPGNGSRAVGYLGFRLAF